MKRPKPLLPMLQPYLPPTKVVEKSAVQSAPGASTPVNVLSYRAGAQAEIADFAVVEIRTAGRACGGGGGAEAAADRARVRRADDLAVVDGRRAVVAGAGGGGQVEEGAGLDR